MKIAVSFYTTEFTKLKQFWNKNSSVNRKGFRGSKVAKDFSQGGLYSLYWFDKKKELETVDLITPGGFDFDSDYFYVAVNSHTIEVLDRNTLKSIDHITNHLFNQLHSVHLTDDGLLVASSGVDSAIEVDKSGEILFHWNAMNYGFDTLPDGRKRILNEQEDHRKKSYATLDQTTHLNSAIYVGSHVYISLFHQGNLVKVNKFNGEIESSISGLSNPHAMYDLGNQLMVSDTSNKRVLFLSYDLEITNSVTVDSDWIQDAIMTSNNTLLVADSNNNQIQELDLQGSLLSKLEYSYERRIYQIKEIL